MVEQRRKDPGRKGRPASRGGKTRASRPSAGRSSGAALGRGRGRRAEGAGPRPRKRARRIDGARILNEGDVTPPRRGRKGVLAEGEF